MGRKIKGRKHRGIRDPEKQRQLKRLSLRDKINAPPSNPDDQHIPKSLTHLMNLKAKVQSGAISLKRKRKSKKKLGPINSNTYGIKPHNTSDKQMPFFQQEPDESDSKFMWRINKMCRSIIDEVEFERKYRVDVKRNPETGQVESVTKRKKDELELYLKQVKKDKKNKKIKGKNKPIIDEPKLSKFQKRQIKLKQKKQVHRDKNVDEFKNYEDRVKFGEIIHEPPTLTVPRRATTGETPRPGKRDLLLKSMINPSREFGKKKSLELENNLKKTSNKVIDKKGKRKSLPHAMRRQLETQQQEIIQAYKKLKCKQYNTA